MSKFAAWLVIMAVFNIVVLGAFWAAGVDVLELKRGATSFLLYCVEVVLAVTAFVSMDGA